MTELPFNPDDPLPESADTQEERKAAALQAFYENVRNAMAIETISAYQARLCGATQEDLEVVTKRAEADESREDEEEGEDEEE